MTGGGSSNPSRVVVLCYVMLFGVLQWPVVDLYEQLQAVPGWRDRWGSRP
jgi:hypothetical protein